jgi:hypothetical protein
MAMPSRSPQEIPPPLFSDIHPKKNGVPSWKEIIITWCQIQAVGLMFHLYKVALVDNFGLGELCELCNCHNAG